jgi:hypothetical protein
MICRFIVLLPHDVALPGAPVLSPQALEIGRYRVVIRPPGYAPIDRGQLSDLSIPLSEVMSGMVLAEAPVDAAVTINGGAATKANVLIIEFLANEFDRRRGAGQDEIDPPLELAFKVANGLLARLRVILRAPHLKELRAEEVPSELVYLNDDGSPLEEHEGKVRAHVNASFSTRLAAITEKGWAEVNSLPWDYELVLWDRLLLDASSLLPEIGASVVLASAALESFADSALQHLVDRGGMNRDLYEWIARRDGKFELQPSFADQFDHLWRAVTGQSLKDNDELWKGFTAIKRARNAIAHGTIPQENGEALSPARASELVGCADRIIAWGEEFLPAELHRPKLPLGDSITMERVLIAPQTPSGS